jgi:hypothetical protein
MRRETSYFLRRCLLDYRSFHSRPKVDVEGSIIVASLHRRTERVTLSLATAGADWKTQKGRAEWYGW